MVYTVSELNAAGISTGGNINDLAFFVTQSPIYNIPGYTIKIKHTTAATSNSIFGNTGWTTVKNSFTYAPTSGGWDLFNLDTPFTWDGVNNIVIQICWSQVSPNYNSSGRCRVFNSTEGYSYIWTDAAGNSCGEVANSNYNTKPQIKFIFDSTTVWTGIVNTDWNNPGNWSNVVPNERLDAIIPSGTPNNPNLTVSANCDDLILTGTLTNSTSGILTIYRDFKNSGVYENSGGTIYLKGSNPSIVTLNSNTSFQDFIIEKSNLVNIVGSGELRIIHELKILNGKLNTNDKLIIHSDANGTGRIDELNAICSYTLDMKDSWGDGWNGGFLTVNINGLSIGDFSATGLGSSASFDAVNGSTIELVYTSGSWENENTYDLLDPTSTIIFSDGTNPSTGSVFTTTSNCSSSTPIITGEIAMERYIDAGETYWRFFSSAVQGATIQDYQDDFVTAGYTGSPFPNFGWVSIYTYDETLPAGSGYTPVTNSNQIIEVGQGIDVWSGDTITGTQPFTVDLHGTVNQGDITFPITYTNTGSLNEDGWNLVGNPYPSTIDWDSPNWTKTNIANAIQILNPDSQQYATYVNGASANGGSRYIASQQAFWVYASASGASLIAKESVKSSTDAIFFKSGSISSGMSIKLNGFNMTDECIIRHVDGATDSYELNYDAYKQYGGWGTYPNISILNTTQQDLTVHSFDKQFQEWEIPIKVIVFQNGFYDLVFSNTSELNVPCLKIEDTYTGVFYDIIENQPLNIELSDTTILPRFILHIGKNYELETIGTQCFNGLNGGVSLNIDNVNMFDYTLSHNGNIINGNSNVNPLNINNLEFGDYNIEIIGLQNTCNTTIFDFTIPTPSPINSIVDLNNEILGNDGSITLSAYGGTPPYTYLWNTQDTINSIFDLTEGNYSILITDMNGCEWSENYLIASSLSIKEDKNNSFNVYYNNSDNSIHILNLTTNENLELYIYNTMGQLIDTHTLKHSEENNSYRLNKKLSKGVYFVKIGNQSVKFNY